MGWLGFPEIVTSVGNFIETNRFFPDVIYVLAAVKIFGHFSRVLGQPSVFGKILAGIIIGPSVLGLVQDSVLIRGMGDIGVILLMFLAGMETDMGRFMGSLKPALYTAFWGVAFPLVLGYLLGVHFAYGQLEALFIGVILVATSVSITVQVLREMGRLQSREGSTILGAAVIDDILGLLILTIAIGFSAGVLTALQIGKTLMKILFFFAAALIIGKRVLPLFFVVTSRMRVSVPLVTGAIIVALIYAVAAQYLGLAGIVGAYLAGLMIGRKHRSSLLKSIEIIGYSFFIPFFFAGIGLNVKIDMLSLDTVIFTAIVLLAAIFSKLFGCVIGARLGGLSLGSSLVVGAGMVPRGEVALIAAKIGIDAGLIGAGLFTSMVTVAILTTILAPPMLRIFIKGDIHI
ncbi:MAG: cation:proton antiporter [Bacillota bacterium]